MLRPVFEVLTVPGFDENTYLIGDADAGSAVVVDPGGRAADLVRVAAERGVKITRIVNTHTHYDHVTGVDALRDLTGATFTIHRDAEPLLDGLNQQASWFGLPYVDSPKVDDFVEDGDTVSVGAIDLEIRLAPGHAPGHLVIVGPAMEIDGETNPFAIVGDVIFYSGIGRTDLPGGDYETLMRSIEREILTLSDDTALYSGHGPATTVGHERQFNPFIREWLAGTRR